MLLLSTLFALPGVFGNESVLIEYHLPTGEFAMTEHGALREAAMHRLELDKINDDPIVEIAAMDCESVN